MPISTYDTLFTDQRTLLGNENVQDVSYKFVIDKKLEVDTGRSTEQGKSLATLNIYFSAHINVL